MRVVNCTWQKNLPKQSRSHPFPTRRPWPPPTWCPLSAGRLGRHFQPGRSWSSTNGRSTISGGHRRPPTWQGRQRRIQDKEPHKSQQGGTAEKMHKELNQESQCRSFCTNRRRFVQRRLIRRPAPRSRLLPLPHVFTKHLAGHVNQLRRVSERSPTPALATAAWHWVVLLEKSFSCTGSNWKDATGGKHFA